MRLIVVFLAFLAVNIAAHSGATERRIITLDQMQKMFADMRAKTQWNLDGPMLWGYFFTDPDPKKLEPVAQELIRTGYRFVRIYQTDNKRTYFLRVEKIEHHTPESLDRRNQELYTLAERYQLASYDGMDVGPAP